MVTCLAPGSSDETHNSSFERIAQEKMTLAILVLFRGGYPQKPVGDLRRRVQCF